MNVMHAKYKIFSIQNTKYFIISDLFKSMLALKQRVKSAAACLMSFMRSLSKPRKFKMNLASQ